MVIEPTLYDSRGYRCTLAVTFVHVSLMGCTSRDAHALLEAYMCFQLSRDSDLTCTSARLGYYSPESKYLEVSKFWFTIHVLGQKF